MKHIYIFLILFSFGFCLNAQSIRKNYQEMTESEKNALVNAFYQLRNGPDLIDNLAIFHNNNFNSIHFNLPAQPQDDIFLAWHRRQIFEVEQAMQDINPNISMPFWDWRTDNSVNSSLWSQSFLGQFDADWNLNRVFDGNISLPSATDVSNIQAISNWLDYSNDLERSPVHTGAHLWVGGTMAGEASPRDPVFYLHHGMIDKLWQDWQETHGTSTYQRTSMARYDGTYTFNGETLPVVNPNDIVDSKSLGVFFAENQLAQLENYAVRNEYRSQENFYYQYTIEIGNNFTVPSAKNSKAESANQIILKPGFHAEAGSTFIAKIDTDEDINTNARVSETIARNQKDFKDINILKDAYINVANKDILNTLGNVAIYPNPFNKKVTVNLNEEVESCKVEIYNLNGIKVYENQFHNSKTLIIDNLHTLNNGLYVLKIINNGNIIMNAKIIKYLE